MNLGHLSIRQPVLAMVLSIVLMIVGGIAYTTLPVAEYPQVALPTIVVSTQYPGANAQTVATKDRPTAKRRKATTPQECELGSGLSM